MTVKFILILCVAVFSVTFAMPSTQPVLKKPKESFQPAETNYLYRYMPISYGFGGYPYVGYRGSYGIGGEGTGLGYDSYRYPYGYSDEYYYPYYY